jgi:hypothetical protein
LSFGTVRLGLDPFVVGSYSAHDCNVLEKEVPMHGGFVIAIVGAIAGLLTAIAAVISAFRKR